MATDKVPELSDVALAAALEECAREPVHTPGAIQSFGVLVCLDAHCQRVLQVSANSASVLELSPAACLSATAEQLLGSSLLRHLRRGLRHSPSMPGMTHKSKRNRHRLHVQAYRSGDRVVVELEPLEGGTRSRWLSLVNEWVAALVQTQDQAQTLDTLTTAVRAISDYDRVLVFRFDEHFNGQVLAENRNPALDSLLGHHFPASDIPPQVRALYDYNPVRMIADSRAPAIPLLPAEAPTLDLSLGYLRAAAPIHQRYMQNMGVGASLSVAVFADSGLWGLLTCHNREPLALSASARDAVAMLTQVASQRLFLLQAREQAQHRQAIHQLRTQLAESIQQQVSPVQLLDHHGPDWLRLFAAHGLALVYRETTHRLGQCPQESQLQALVQWLESVHGDSTPWHTSSLHDAGFMQASELESVCCGLLAQPLLFDLSVRGWLLLFRPEQVRTIDWAGEPQKRTETTARGQVCLSPRDSFAAWREEVRGHSLAWSETDSRAALDLGDDLAVAASAHEINRLNESLLRQRQALAEANRHLRELAHTDTLTGTLNRYRIEHLVQMALANAQRYDQHFSLLLFDIDHFKQVNDTHGHKEGDRILQVLVETLTGELREGDQLGRWGGEEFLVLLPHTLLEDALVFAERLRARVATTDFALPEPITISIGVTQWQSNDSLKALLVRADKAMYQAKHGGRNQVRSLN